MPGKLNLYNLGDLGVQLVETPIHSPDGSFTAAQNASVSQNQGQHGIRKRLGMAKLTTDALGGSVLAIGNMPFADPNVAPDILGTRLYVNTSSSDPIIAIQQSTTNGTVWATVDSFPHAWTGLSNFDGRFSQRGGAISETGLLTYYYYTGLADVLAEWDGTTETIIATDIPWGAGFSPHGGPVRDGEGTIWGCADDNNTGRLFRYVGGDTMELVSDAIGKPAINVCPAFGRIYVGTSENRIYYYSIGDGLVLDITIAATGGNVSITDMVIYNGVLYATCCTKPSGALATTHKVLKRTADAAWSDITPEATGDYGPMAVFNGHLYVVRQTRTGFSGCEVRRYDGATWTTDQDVTALVTGASGVRRLREFNGALYANVAGSSTFAVIRRTTSAWSSVLSVAAAAESTPSGGMGFY